jgi:hypothetical protein
MNEVNEALKLISQAKEQIMQFQKQQSYFEELECAIHYLDEAIEKLAK